LVLATLVARTCGGGLKPPRDGRWCVMAKMERKTFEVKEQSIEGRTVTGIASVFGNVDDGLDRIWKGAFKKTLAENSGRVRHLWQHDYMQPPTAKVVELKEIGKRELPDWIREKFPDATGGLLVKRDYLPTPRGDEILAGITSGAIAEMSIGYESVKYDYEERALSEDVSQQVRNLREIRLFDTSDVNWGMNQATAAAKAAVPYRDTGTADEGTDWSKPGLGDFTAEVWEELDAAEKRRIGAHFGWAAAMPPETFGELKLPHHQASKTDVGPAVWNGVKAAMSRLMQAGTDIPEGDVPAVHSHLSKHYKEFDKEPPTLKSLQLVAAIQVEMADLTTGRSHLMMKDVERIA